MLAGKRPTHLGVAAGKLAPCSNKPNCVNSQAETDTHQIAPLSYSGASAQAMIHLKEVIEAMARTRIITVTDNYLYAEFTSRILRFVDDVEFWLDADAQVIHVRSASRVGYSDLGVNRQRVERIRAQFNQCLGNPDGCVK